MKKFRLILLVIILVALALRLYNLTYHSLWFDEAISVHWARQSVPRILEVGFNLVEDRLPPLYYLMLKGWTTLFGYSEVSVRSLSVLLGVLLVPVIANIAAMLFSQQVALATAVLVALNPFLIWYSQEARMYAPAVLFSTLAVWAFLRMCQAANSDSVKHDSQQVLRLVSHRATFIFLFALFAIAGLYSHLYTGLLLPALGLWLIISYPRAWRLWLTVALSGLVIALVYAPIAIATWRFSGQATPGNPLIGLGQRAWWLLRAFTIWKAPLSSTLQRTIPATLLFFVLVAYAKHHDGSRNHRALATRNKLGEANNTSPSPVIPHPLLLVTLLLILPFAIANLLLLRNHLAFFGERYFILMVPWLLLLATVGADNLGQWLQRITNREAADGKSRRSRNTLYGSNLRFGFSRLFYYLPFLLLYVLTAIPISGQWSIPAAKEAWRQSAAYLAQHALPNHGILIHPDWVRFPLQFYFEGPGETYAAFSNVTSETPLDGPLQGVVGHHPVIWLIQSHLDEPDPNRLVEQWFDMRYPLVTELYPPGIVLKGYATTYLFDRLPLDATPVQILFDNGMQLVGYKTDQVVSASDDLFHPPSGWLHVILYWTANQTISTDVTPFVHVTGPEGVWGVNLERTNDVLKVYPPSRWSSSTDTKPIIRHDVDVNLNPATPPGIYQLVVGLRDHGSQFLLTELEID